jgi:hypothetical protein
MTKTLTALALAAALLVPALPAMAHDHERVQHYAVDAKPTTVEEARKLKHGATKSLAEAVKAGNWELVHERTYPLEAALEVLETTKEANEAAILKAYAFVLEEIHLASEDGKGDIIKANLPILLELEKMYHKAYK